MTEVRWTATDLSGNSSDCTSIVEVVDDVLPTIVCPEDLTFEIRSGEPNPVVFYEPPVGLDNCPGAETTLTEGIESGLAFQQNVHPVRSLRARDEQAAGSGIRDQDEELPTHRAVPRPQNPR